MEQAQEELLNLKLNLPEDWIKPDTVAHWMDQETAAGFLLHSMRAFKGKARSQGVGCRGLAYSPFFIAYCYYFRFHYALCSFRL